MEYKKTKRTSQYIFEGSRHAVKRQKMNVSPECKGILISTLSPKRMTIGIKEFLNFLKVNFPIDEDKREEVKNDEKPNGGEEKDEKQNGGENKDEKQNGGENKDEKPNGGEQKNEKESEKKSYSIEKQFNNEIEKENKEYNRFAPLRNIIKNFTFIKFNNMYDKSPSDIVQEIFVLAHNKKEKYILRHLCKIIPLDCICKPHISPFTKSILPIMKKNFSRSTCVQKNFTVSHLLKLMNVSVEKEISEEVEGEEVEGKEVEGKEVEGKEVENGIKTKEVSEVRQEVHIKKDEQENESEQKKDHAKEEQKNSNVNKDVPEKKLSWALIYKCSNTKTLSKRDVLTVLDNCIGNNYSVNLNNPDLAIVVYVTEIMCGISIVKGYGKTRKFNISAFNEDS
ncbi:hypothetical protein, conserved [Plasmodium gonderi]|uniref:THUMP domain-containing protein n=1 Tax=Plasmodium gonderi TaxID=77519 RepID=A0A1Y1JVC7_PLAGO|nr:hypothetical protein, conserved [Plasmodium gonderi]GAW83854.1 hypothetical protein, conserved [Plasmodium gonderi]